MIQRMVHGMSILLPFIGVILVVTQLVVSNYLVSVSKNTLHLDQEIVKIREQNEVLRQQVAQETSLSKIEEKASELGLVKSVHIFTLTPPNVAYNRTQ